MGAVRLEGLWPGPEEIARSPGRLVKTRGSRSEERSKLVVSSTRGQPRGKDFAFRLPMWKSRAAPGSHQSNEVGNAGAGVHVGIKSATVRFLQHPCLRSSLECLR